MSGKPNRTSPFEVAYDMGSTRYVLSLRARGLGDEEIARRLHERHPYPSMQSARALVGRADKAESAADDLQRSADARRLGADEVARPDKGCLRWHYVVQVQWAIPGGPIHAPLVSWKESQSASRRDVLDYAMGYVQAAQQGGDSADRNYGGGFTNVQILSAEIVAVERAC